MCSPKKSGCWIALLMFLAYFIDRHNAIFWLVIKGQINDRYSISETGYK